MLKSSGWIAPRILKLLSIVFVLWTPAVSATAIFYELTHVGGSSYRYDYTVVNDSLSIPLALFDIDFDPALYDEPSLSIQSAPAIQLDWDELILGSGIGTPAFYDALAVGTGIPVGGSVDGFAVAFDWLGSGQPGAQPFSIFDPNTFDLLDSGRTRLQGTPPPSVPIPGTLLLLLPFMFLVYKTGSTRLH
jgi:hypothetical protein